MNDYSRIATVIEYLGKHYHEQPNLEDLAKQVGLSQFHFHRLFHRWAGITPKSFLQCLTAAEAKELLNEGRSVLDTALDVGLSGPSRLHDLFVNLEAASPGEVKSGGEGWIVRSGFANSPFGQALVALSPRGICWLSFVVEGAAESAEWTKLQSCWPRAEFVRDDEMASALIDRIFRPQRAASPLEPLNVLVKGSAFQVKVWRALVDIPFGGLRSYGDVAREMGTPDSARAIGNAAGKNMLAFLLPCHRVIVSSGMTGNYRWGATRKQAIIAWEHSLRREQ